MLKIGDIASAFTLNDDAGKTVSLSDFRAKKVVLYFYPTANTPDCTKNGGKRPRGF